MAHLPMGEVVRINEYDIPRIVTIDSSHDAKNYLASQMYTDAVFNSDIRVIQTIIQRVDGGLPKDTEVGAYQTLFGDCIQQVLEMDNHTQLKVLPSDTVMMALSKSLYDIASTDIYHEMRSDKNGNHWAKKVNPSTERKQARDSALRLVLERSGGRKTATVARVQETARVRVASWITGVLPQGGEVDAVGTEEADPRGARVAL
jgi:hypothetical protein